MKAIELRIGNYLRVGNLPFPVAQVYTPTIAGDLCDGFILEDGTEDDGEPIVITRRILHQLGWHVGGMQTYYFISDKPERRMTYNFFDHTLVITRDDSTYSRRKRKTMLSMCVDYVHELQNCMIQCGMMPDFELKPSDIYDD